MSRRNHESIWLIGVATFFTGLLGASIGTWIADFNFHSHAMLVAVVGAVGGGLVGRFSGAILKLTPRRD
jgi:hypothetical protein